MKTLRMAKIYQKDTTQLLRQLYLLLFLILPWSYQLSLGTFSVVLPTEPLLILILLLWVKEIRQKPTIISILKIDFKKNLLASASLLWMLWQIICVFTSLMPLVSAKYVLIETLHFLVFGVGVFIFPTLFWSNLPWLIGSMSTFIFFCLIQHSTYQFQPEQSNLGVLPFFPDHTMYSAVLVMLFCLLPLLIENKVIEKKKWLIGLVFVLFSVGIYFSYCRAAWLSLIILGFIGLFLWMCRLSKKNTIVLTILLFGVFLFLKNNFSPKINSDGNTSSSIGQLSSVANLKNDASNLERLNRYSCAWRMGIDRPLFGFGSGTYQFQYFAYQKPEEMTRISVTSPPIKQNGYGNGRGGGAHSEYLQAFSELGWIGLGLWLAITGISICSLSIIEMWTIKNILLITSLASFFLHAFVNNFLHDPRIAVLFWGQIAVLCAYGRKKEYI
jgi:putative inorganic carbon (hco3(-)) transporter